MSIRVFKALSASSLFSNSLWGLLATIIQNALLSIFFIALARVYNTTHFADFIIASALYQIMVSLSTMGLGQWFIREHSNTNEHQRETFVSIFFKIQFILGFVFYLLNIAVSFLLYGGAEILLLSIILGLNIIIDNLLYSITRLNIAESKQSRTLIALALDGGLRMLTIVVLLMFNLSIVQLSILVVALRLLSLSIFLFNFQNSIHGIAIVMARINWSHVNHVVFKNWRFIVTGGVYIINWRIANVMISKLLSVQEVANYEIAFKIFSIAAMAPAALSGTAFTYFVKFIRAGDQQMVKKLLAANFKAYSLFALTCYAFVYSFSDTLVPWIFGDKYALASGSVQLMFLTLIISITSALQANVIIALGQERRDMVYNIVNMVVCLLGTTVGLYYFRTLETVNYSILGSIFMFHILQDFFLVKRGLIGSSNRILYYVFLVVFLIAYHKASQVFNGFAVFGVFLIAACFVAMNLLTKIRANDPIVSNYSTK